MYIILASLFLLNRYYIAAGSALAILPFIFISTTPSIGIGVVTLTAYLVLTRKISWTKSFAMVTPIIVSVLCIIIFYALHPEPYKFPAEGRSISLQSIVPKLSEFRVLFNGTAGVFINYSIYFAPYIILLLLLLILRRESNVFYGLPKVIWVWFGASIVTAAVTRAFGTHYLDSFQFFSNIMMPMTPVILAILLACILRQAATESYLITLVVIVTLICVNFSGIGTGATRYSSEFMRNISHAITSTGFRGAYILDDSDYQNAYMLSSDSYTAGSYVSNFKNDYALPSLSELDVDSLSTDIRFKVDSAQAEQIIRKSSIYRFAKFQSLNKQKLSLDSIKYKYVIKNKISFICASRKAKMPLTLQPLVKVMYTDSLSGERFYLLNFKQSAVATNAYD
ncbi:MAG: hypothetical protein EOO61_04080 [Hymenobacter sp.]|nr:MAG: hypothetical protein EOO61_04080 [Hymenobacter sp.]